MKNLYDLEGKTNYAMIIGIFAISAMFVALSPALATTVYQQIAVNGTGSVYNGFMNNDVMYENVIYIDGVAYFNLTYNDGSEKIVELEQYVAAKEGDWTSDGRGVSMDEVVNALDRAARYKLGQIDYIDDRQKAILYAIDAIVKEDLDEYFQKNMKQVVDAIKQQQTTTLQNTYDIEAIYRTLEKTNPEVYCQSRLEVVKKYNLPSVKCGLHSKRCYNGDQFTQEGGRDFCIHTEAEIEYLPCYNTLGRCGRLDKVEILDSEESSYTPIRITFSNTGTMALNPNVSFEVQDPYNYEVFKNYAQDLGEVAPGETKVFVVYLDNSGLESGKVYSLLTTVQSSRKEVLDKAEYKLKPEGTFQKAGTFAVKHSEAGYKRDMQITGTYENLNDNSYKVVMVADVFLDGKRYTSVGSGDIAVKGGETKDITIVYKPDSVGNYTVQVRIEKTDLKQSFEFPIEMPTVTGMLATAVANSPNGESANAGEKVNANSVSLTLGALALMFCVISALVYWSKSKKVAA